MTASTQAPGEQRVSVVIPCFNHARYLQQAIASAFAQTLPAAEILVVDDGSTDDTPEVTARFQAPVAYIRQQNRGLSAARNTGIRRATGDLVAFLDADDSWLPEFLATLVSLLRANPELCAAHSGSIFTAEDGGSLPQRSTQTVAAPAMFDALTDGQFFVPSSVVARRAVLLECGGFDEALRAAEDWDMWLRLSRRYPFGGVSTCLVHYRRHAGNMTSDVQRMLDNELAVVEKNFGPLIGEPANWPRQRRRAAAGAFLKTTLRYLVRGDVESGGHYLRRAFLARPELSEHPDVFYELGCANQPLGWRGHAGTLAIETNAALTLGLLRDLFDSPSLPQELQARRGSAYVTAFYALGLLAYNAGRSAIARRFLWRTLQRRPRGRLGLKTAVLLAKASAPHQARAFARSVRGIRLLQHSPV